MKLYSCKDLAETHGGQRGRAEAGKNGGGRAAYGYRVIHQPGGSGGPIWGERAMIADPPLHHRDRLAHRSG
jgi:hypothetical protein